MSENQKELTKDELAEQASRPDLDSIYHQNSRRVGDPVGMNDDPDVERKETPHGWEERKLEVEVESDDGQQNPSGRSKPDR